MSLASTTRLRPDIPALTSIRFFAALWVVLFHIREIGLWTGGTPLYQSIISVGYLGVGFFFVLSGFILVYVYAGREIAKPRFWQARFARIYPAYLFSLLVTIPNLLHFLPIAQRMHVGGLVLVSNPLLLEAWFPRILFFWNPVAWSLSVEVIFYLIFPFAMRLLEKLGRNRLPLWIAASWLASLVFTTSYVLLHPDGVLHTTSQSNDLPWLGVLKLNPLVRLPEFLLGMGAGALFLQLPSRSRTWPILTAAGLLVLAIAIRNVIPYPILHTGLLAPVFALLIFGLATQPAWTRAFSAAPLILLGEASYSLYLLHTVPIVTLTFGMRLGNSPHILAIVAAYLVGTCLVSIAVYLLIEKPARRLLRPRINRVSASPGSSSTALSASS